jgi:hypothetical protein
MIVLAVGLTDLTPRINIKILKSNEDVRMASNRCRLYWTYQQQEN